MQTPEPVKLTDGTELSPQYVTAGEYWIKLLHMSLPDVLFWIWMKCVNPETELPDDVKTQLREREYISADGVIPEDFRALIRCTCTVTVDGNDAEITLQNPRAARG